MGNPAIFTSSQEQGSCDRCQHVEYFESWFGHRVARCGSWNRFNQTPHQGCARFEERAAQPVDVTPSKTQR